MNQKGESLITIIIALVLVVGVFVIAAPSLLNVAKQNKRALATPNVCRIVARNVIHKIQSNGVQTKAYRAPVDSSSLLFSDSSWHEGKVAFNKDGVLKEVGSVGHLGGVRWPAKRIISWQSGTKKYLVHTPLLIHSSVNSLLSIYNSPGNSACTQPFGVTIDSSSLSDLEPEDTKDGYKVSSSIRIQPYDLNTGEILPCTTPLWLRPYAAQEPPLSDQLDITDFSQYRPDRGLEVEVFVQAVAETPDGVDESESFECSVKERFHFDRLADKPPAPKIEMTGNSVEFSIPFADYDPGTHMVCRSTHNFFDPDRNGEATRAVGEFATPGSPAVPSDWVPCDRLQVCGVSASNIKVDRDMASITIDYPIPGNCILAIDARVFDVVGNVSSRKTVSYFAGDPTTPTESGDPSSSGVAAYEVGGLQFNTVQAAQQAAAISGLAIAQIQGPVAGLDAQMNQAAAGLNGTTSSRDVASNAAAAAGAAAAAAGAAASAASGPGSAASAAASAASAAAAASQASAAAAQASAAAQAARDSLSSVQSAASSLGSIGKAAVEQAQAAVEAAEAAAKAAEEAAKAAEEAAKAAAEAAAAKAEAESESDGDGDGEDSGI